MIFEPKITGELLDLQLDFKAPNVPETGSDVKKARVFIDMIKQNKTRLRVLSDFEKIKNIIQAKSVMNQWLEKAKNGNSATYYMYPKNSDSCVGCMRIKTDGKIAETAFWTSQEATGKGYMQDAIKAIEKIMFQNGATEIIQRVYVNNPCHNAVKHIIQKTGYISCPFKGIGYKAGDEKVFEAFHKTADMYYGYTQKALNHFTHTGR